MTRRFESSMTPEEAIKQFVYVYERWESHKEGLKAVERNEYDLAPGHGLSYNIYYGKEKVGEAGRNGAVMLKFPYQLKLKDEGPRYF